MMRAILKCGMIKAVRSGSILPRQGEGRPSSTQDIRGFSIFPAGRHNASVYPLPPSGMILPGGAGIDIMSDGNEIQQFVAAEKIHMGIPKDEGGTAAVMLPICLREIGLLKTAAGIFRLRQQREDISDHFQTQGYGLNGHLRPDGVHIAGYPAKKPGELFRRIFWIASCFENPVHGGGCY